jgi:hypothetical protein
MISPISVLHTTIKAHDSLKVEAVRLATFSTFPSAACAYATKLASAGFYYNGNGDEVVCFNCGMKFNP